MILKFPIMPYTHRLLSLLVIALAVILAACEEGPEAIEAKKPDITVSSGILPPKLNLLEAPSATVAKFGVAVDASQAQDTVYYAVLEAQDEVPNGPTLLAHAGVVKFLMSGNVFRPAYQPDLSEQTDYVVYALIKEGNYVSKITPLNLRAPSDQPTDPVADDPGEDDEPEEPTDDGGGDDGGTDDDGAGQGGDGSGDDGNGGSDDDGNTDDGDDDSGNDGGDTGSGGGDGDGGDTDPDNGGGEPDGIQPTLDDPTVERTGLAESQRFQISVAVTTEEPVDGMVHYLAISERSHEEAPTPQELLENRFTRSRAIKGDYSGFSIGANSDTKYFIYFLLKVGDEVSGVVLLEAKTAP